MDLLAWMAEQESSESFCPTPSFFGLTNEHQKEDEEKKESEPTSSARLGCRSLKSVTFFLHPFGFVGFHLQIELCRLHVTDVYATHNP